MMLRVVDYFDVYATTTAADDDDDDSDSDGIFNVSNSLITLI